MKANMLDYMYEGYGYDTDNQLLYVNVENFDETLSPSGEMTTNGMETLAYNNGPIGHDEAIPTVEDANYNEIMSFTEESVKEYTDLRQSKCNC